MPTIVHFDIAADEPERAKTFYSALFGWKIISPEGFLDYSLIETTDLEGRPGAGGGLGKRGAPGQAITVYFGVDSIAAYLPRIGQLGGKVLMPKTPVPGFGALAICADTEGNTFGLWEDEKNRYER